MSLYGIEPRDFRMPPRMRDPAILSSSRIQATNTCKLCKRPRAQSAATHRRKKSVSDAPPRWAVFLARQLTRRKKQSTRFIASAERTSRIAPRPTIAKSDKTQARRCGCHTICRAGMMHSQRRWPREPSVSTFHVYLIGGAIFAALVVITIIAARLLSRP